MYVPFSFFLAFQVSYNIIYYPTLKVYRNKEF
jgi:hypothetical protein